MTRETDYHGWTIPTEGETENWDVILNEFFEGGLDLDVTMTGGLADLPQPTDDAPTLFFATGEEAMYFNDGAQWREVLTYDDSDAIDAIEQAAGLRLGNDLNIDTIIGDDPALTFAENGEDKFQWFHDVSTDASVLYSYVMDQRVLEIRADGVFDILLDEVRINGSTLSKGVDTSGQVTLSSGSATVTTGVSSSTTATFQVAAGPTTDDAEIEWSVRAVSGGNYQVHFHETNTSVGNPDVEYDIIRVR